MERDNSSENINKELLAPCGLYCGVCGVLIAYRDNNSKFKKKLAALYGVTEEEIQCEGCKSKVVFKYCKICPIKSCTEAKGYEGCHECDDFPCNLIKQFPMPVGRKVMLRAIPEWREKGAAQWIADEVKRYHCPECGYILFRGAKRCRNCKKEVDLD